MDLFSILDGTPEPPIVDLHLDIDNISGEYDLATPMFDFQKELTDQIVSLHYPDILKYCETNDTTELIIKSLEICVENCMLVASHPYLLIKHYMPKNFNVRDLPAKLAETSGKFSVLRNVINVILLNLMLPLAKNVGIIMRNDQKTLDLTEALLLGTHGQKQIYRYVGNSVKRESNKSGRTSARDSRITNLHLLPSDGEITRFSSELPGVKFDILIALDGTVDTKGDFVSRLKVQGCRGNDAAVILKLIPMFSIEHCLEHYSSEKNTASFLYKLISSIVCLRDQVGNLLPDLVPIYNHNLTYLSHTFFDHVFRRELRSFPKWPLPELPNISSFSATDVERSLLTEVVYHYTPYDSNELLGDTAYKTKKSYYESKRLQLDYVTNPLKHNYASLSGIHNHHLSTLKSAKDPYIMTHMLLLKLNAGYSDLSLIKEEFDSYINFNTAEKQRSFGRRLDEIKRALTSIIEDCDHAEQRLLVTQKKISKKGEENEVLSKNISDLNKQLTSFVEDKKFESGSAKEKFANQQLRIWELQNDIKALVAKTKSKEEEKSYMETELASCKDSIEKSKAQIHTATEECKVLKNKINEASEMEESEAREFKKLRALKLSEIESARTTNDNLKSNFASTLKFLRETSHIKKRKGRGLTPSGR
ncbi:hypothetical protein PUMCH_001780 [Australozyma saopauloensis]|uniref:HDA1 complex subunit 2 n=1 Tax=Australozyma saopauloensis TaxID=291208 RepID=A0AAX4H7D9_9ASCO|nr:hypothetical protein PUMCH_001780 [[Candida] saopauloensis]